MDGASVQAILFWAHSLWVVCHILLLLPKVFYPYPCPFLGRKVFCLYQGPYLGLFLVLVRSPNENACLPNTFPDCVLEEGNLFF